MTKYPMTISGFKALEIELDTLKTTERPAVIKAIATAREHGDLKENAEYHAARERQSFIEGRILQLEDYTGHAEIIDPAKLNGNTVKFGATVTLIDEITEKEATYQIVGEPESDIEKKRLSYTAPLARGLIGKSIGDCVEVTTPGGVKSYEILDVAFQ